MAWTKQQHKTQEKAKKT